MRSHDRHSLKPFKKLSDRVPKCPHRSARPPAWMRVPAVPHPQRHLAHCHHVIGEDAFEESNKQYSQQPNGGRNREPISGGINRSGVPTDRGIIIQP